MRRTQGLLLECLSCHRMRPRGCFERRGNGRRARCKDCHKPVRAVSAHRRRTRLMNRGSFTADQIKGLWLKQGGRCAISGAYLSITGYHIDHKLSLAKGGMNTIDNLQLLAPLVNLQKGAA